MQNAVLVLTIIVCVVLVALILIQGRGAGLGSAWGGGGETFQTRRGLEKVTIYMTVVGTALFFLLSLVNILIA